MTRFSTVSADLIMCRDWLINFHFQPSHLYFSTNYCARTEIDLSYANHNRSSVDELFRDLSKESPCQLGTFVTT